MTCPIKACHVREHIILLSNKENVILTAMHKLQRIGMKLTLQTK